MRSHSLLPAYQDMHSCPHTMLLWWSARGHRTKQASSGIINPNKPFLLYVVVLWSQRSAECLPLPNPGTTLWTSVAVVLCNIQGIWRERKKTHVIFTLSNKNFIPKATEFVICQKESRIKLKIVLSKNEELFIFVYVQMYSRTAQMKLLWGKTVSLTTWQPFKGFIYK